MTATMYPPVHPGEILREEFLEPLGITPYRLAQATGLSQTAISQILRGTRSITPATGIRISKALGLTERYWLNAQARYDIEIEHDQHATELEHVQVLVST